MTTASSLLPSGYSLRCLRQSDDADIARICELVYPTETPYRRDELSAHQRRFPEGQFVVTHDATGTTVAGHFTLIIRMRNFHIDDSWDVLTAKDTFADHDPAHGETLYGADLIVDPAHQHHGIGRALTLAARELVRSRRLWRMVGGSRMPGYSEYQDRLSPTEYVAKVKQKALTDPVLTAHLHDGWDVVCPIRGYLPFDTESAGWAAVILWINPDCPPPPGEDLERLRRR